LYCNLTGNIFNVITVKAKNNGTNMKKLLLILLILSSLNVYAQFRDELNKQPDIKSGILNNSSSSLFGLFNPDNFKMSHTFDLSYQTSGFGNLALSTYTNSMFYKFNDQLNFQADISLVNSPYNSFGKEFSKQINGIYLSRAQLNYKPSENMNIILQYRSYPAGYYSPYMYDNYPFYRSSWFDSRWDEK
jgi:hypothetical protein